MKPINKFAKIALHILFWITVGFFFVRFSNIRPSCINQEYKEILCMVMIVMVIYLNGVLLFPKLYLKGKYLWYWGINIVWLFAIGFSEIQLVKSNIYHCLGSTLSNKEFQFYLLILFFLITFRDALFFAFFFIIWVNKNFRHLLLSHQELLAVENKQIAITSTLGKDFLVPICDITHISVEGKVSKVHLINDKEYSQIKTLNEYEKILPEHLYLRISRNILIMYNYVCEYNDSNVVIKINNKGDKKDFSFFKNQNEKILDNLKKYVTQEIKNRNCNAKKDENAPDLRIKRNENCELNEISKQILEVIQSQPRIFASEIKSSLPQFSERTIDSYLHLLKDLGFIVYKDSKKTGGYYSI